MAPGPTGRAAAGLGGRPLGPPRRGPGLDRRRVDPAPPAGLGVGRAAVGVERRPLAVAGRALGAAFLGARPGAPGAEIRLRPRPTPAVLQLSICLIAD